MADDALMLIIRFMNRNQDWLEAKHDEEEARKSGVERDYEEARVKH